MNSLQVNQSEAGGQNIGATTAENVGREVRSG
jgi:hypothetical protein